MRVRTNNGFTIVEIIVVIAVVAILSSLAVITFSSIRQDTRDATRQGNATIISEALEKYYDQNGEYPSVVSIVNSQSGNTGTAVASKLSIPATSLVMPNMPTSATNAIAPGSDPYNDYIVYEATSSVNNTSCQSSTSGGCDKYTLRYIEEATDVVKVIESRRGSRATASKPSLELTVTSASSISATWTAVIGATSYELQRSTSSGMTSPVTTTHDSTSGSATGLGANTTYYFRVRAVSPEKFSDWSDVQSAATSGLAAPTGTITIAAAMSGANARGTAGGGTCISGSTIEYQIRYQVNGGGWFDYTTGSPRDIAATEGYTYTFQAQARCKAGTTEGPWAHSTTASITRSVTAPSSLTISATISGTNARGTAGGGSCASGTTIDRQIRYKINAGSYVSYTTGSPRDIAATQGSRYTFQQQARCVGTNASSGWAASGESYIDRPYDTPTAPSLSISTSGSTTTWTASASCPSGTTATYERQSLQEGGSWTGWEGTTTTNTSNWNTSAQGYTYSRIYRVQCVGTYTSSPWSLQSVTQSYERPITVAQATGWTHVSLGWQHESKCMYYNGCKWRRYNWTNPTCPAGTSYYTSRWNSYVGSKMSWDNGQNAIYRWWYGLSQTGTTSDSLAYTSAQNSHIVEYRYNVPSDYDNVKHKLIYTCKNNITNRTGTSETVSPVFRYM